MAISTTREELTDEKEVTIFDHLEERRGRLLIAVTEACGSWSSFSCSCSVWIILPGKRERERNFCNFSLSEHNLCTFSLSIPSLQLLSQHIIFATTSLSTIYASSLCKSVWKLFEIRPIFA
jgi:hypothetical protein